MKEKKKKIGLICPWWTCRYSQHMCQMDSFEDQDRNRLNHSLSFLFFYIFQMWHASDTSPLTTTRRFTLPRRSLWSTVIENEWDELLIFQWLEMRMSFAPSLVQCAISQSIADCLYLLGFEIDHRLALWSSRKKNISRHTHARSSINYFFQSNLQTVQCSERLNSCRHSPAWTKSNDVCVCVAMSSFEHISEFE